MIHPSLVSAVVITRGDVDLDPILAAIPFDDLIIWGLSEEESGARCYGRYLAAEQALQDVIYFQDDDLIFHGFDDLLAAYEPGMMHVNMPSPWYERTGYDELGCGLVGAGSLVPKGIWESAFDRYRQHHPEDELFLTYADVVNGILTPHRRYDFGYEILPQAERPGRIGTSPGAHERKQAVVERTVALRDG